VNILNPDGSLSGNAPEKYRGLKVPEARKAVLADLEALGLLKSEEKLIHAVGHCYRCHTSIEPYLSKQWFVRMKPLAEKALSAWRSGDVVFFPGSGRIPTRTGWRISAIGAFPVSSGGDTEFPPFIASTAAPFLWSGKIPLFAPNAVPANSIRTKTFWIPGSPAGSGPSAPWAGQRIRRISGASIPPAPWSPATT
jgi:hypothetical protein